MKKILAMIIVTALAAAMVACSKPAPASSTPAASKPAASTPAASTPAASTPDASTPDEGGDVIVDFTEAFMGMTEANEAVCLAYNADMSLSILMAVNEEGEYVTFVGPGVNNGDGTMTITDDENQLALTFGVEALENGNYKLDMGDLGTAEVEPCDVQEAIDMMNTVDSVGTAVA